MKFKVGDKVKIIKLCSTEKCFDASAFRSLIGKTDTITKIQKQGSVSLFKLAKTGLWFYDWMLEPVTPSQKGIYIKAEKVWSASGKPVYKVLEISALPVLQLPIEYLKSEGSISYDCKKLIISTQLRHCTLLDPGVCYTREDFEDAIKKIKAAGNMLAEINKKLKWSGVEEFTI